MTGIDARHFVYAAFVLGLGLGLYLGGCFAPAPRPRVLTVYHNHGAQVHP